MRTVVAPLRLLSLCGRLVRSRLGSREKEDKTLWLNLCVLNLGVPGFAVDRRTLNTQILYNSGLKEFPIIV